MPFSYCTYFRWNILSTQMCHIDGHTYRELSFKRVILECNEICFDAPLLPPTHRLAGDKLTDTNQDLDLKA
ncbi:hypothetical protein AALO_G00016280 [Alosa alosa]|uniref:Uncharacterized protein n=1 Tax=Alosa alosa TaxID=278164 RepID=A0AAV6HGS9_9TELE|nr:hypothetical protein AALO_G00016280 [Alosa alosa]